MTFGWHTGVSDRDVLMHTLPMFHCNGWGMPYAVTGMGGPARRGAQDRRRGDPSRGSNATGSPSCAGPRPWWPPSSMRPRPGCAKGGPFPGVAPVRIVVAGAPPPSKAIERVETELGWEFIQIYGLTETAPLLTVNRAPAEWDDRHAGRALAPAEPRRRARHRCADRHRARKARCWPAPTMSSPGTGNSRRSRRRRSTAGGSTPATAATSTASYLVISDRKKDVIITGGENVSSIEVEDCLYQHPAVAEVAVIGVPTRSGARRSRRSWFCVPSVDGVGGGTHRALPGPHGPFQGADQRRVP